MKDEQAFLKCARKELDTLQEKQGAINAQKEKLAHYKKLQGIFPYYHAYDTAAEQYEKRMQQTQLAYEKLKKIQGKFFRKRAKTAGRKFTET